MATASDLIRPHEQTTKKAASDRLTSLRETGTNISMIYGLSMATGWEHHLEPVGAPQISCTDEEDVLHEAWVVDDPAAVESIRSTLSAEPIVIADGHHRWTVANQLLNADDAPAGAERIMTLVVPLDERFLTVRPIHRSLLDATVDADELLLVLEAIAKVEPADPATMAAQAGDRIGVVIGDRGAWLNPTLRDQDLEHLGAFPESLRDLDVLWIHEVLMPHIGSHSAVFHHDPADVIGRVGSSAVGAILCTPVSVPKITEVGQAGERMPPKTTFFWPKARTGIVLRRFSDNP